MMGRKDKKSDEWRVTNDEWTLGQVRLTKSTYPNNKKSDELQIANYEWTATNDRHNTKALSNTKIKIRLVAYQLTSLIWAKKIMLGAYDRRLKSGSIINFEHDHVPISGHAYRKL